MARLLFRISTIMLLLSGLAFADATKLQIKEITTLDKNEPWIEAQAFNGGVLWVGRSARGGESLHQVEAYRPDGTAAAAPLKIRHSAEYLYPFGKHSVLVVGKSATPYFQTHYTIARLESGRIVARHKTFPDELMMTRFGGDATHMFFSEPGLAAVFSFERIESQEDDGTAAPLVQEEREDLAAITAADDNGIEEPVVSLPPNIHRLAPKIHGPWQMLLADGNLFVIEENDAGPVSQNLVKIDLASESASRTFRKLRAGLTTMVALPDHRLAITERGRGQVLIVHTDTNQVNEAENLKVPGLPWGMTSYGKHCIAVMAQATSHVHLFDVDRPGTPQVAEWDVSTPINRFHRPRNIVSDPESGRIFIRSDETCPTCQVSFNKEFSVEETGGATFARCN